MSQNDQISAAMDRLEGVVNTLLPEIKSEIDDFAASLAQVANAPTAEQVNALVARANALSDKVDAATTCLQADNPPAPQAHKR